LEVETEYQNPILLGRVGKGLNAIITVLKEYNTTLGRKSPKTPFSQSTYSSTTSTSTGRIADADGEWGEGVGGLGKGLYPPLWAFARWGVQCFKLLPTLLRAKPLLRAFAR